ncbi:MAG: hypothetical protein RDV48_27255 [Candidatus Eremiobacteraeota bacterium]|nr:hypothetical protein [Candidatus Eremiobacteraeota bacterium]
MNALRKQKLSINLEKVAEVLETELLNETDGWRNIPIAAACGSDLMSDVLAFVKPDCLLFTGLTNIQVVRTAEITDLKAVCFVRGKKPTPDALELARKLGIPILATKLPMFESCGRLYMHGVQGVSEMDRS